MKVVNLIALALLVLCFVGRTSASEWEFVSATYTETDDYTDGTGTGNVSGGQGWLSVWVDASANSYGDEEGHASFSGQVMETWRRTGRLSYSTEFTLTGSSTGNLVTYGGAYGEGESGGSSAYVSGGGTVGGAGINVGASGSYYMGSSNGSANATWWPESDYFTWDAEENLDERFDAWVAELDYDVTSPGEISYTFIVPGGDLNDELYITYSLGMSCGASWSGDPEMVTAASGANGEMSTSVSVSYDDWPY